MQQVPGSKPAQPGWGLTQPSIPLWVGKMSTGKNIGQDSTCASPAWDVSCMLI